MALFTDIGHQSDGINEPERDQDLAINVELPFRVGTAVVGENMDIA